jgi:hypothetical protein
VNWFTIALILSRTARGFGSASPALFEDVIDPVQSKKADEDQIDGHCGAHDPRRDQQEYSRDHRGDRQKVLDTAGVHRELIADSDGSPGKPCASADPPAHDSRHKPDLPATFSSPACGRRKFW